MSLPRGTFRLPVARGWLLLLLALIGAATASVYDRRLKESPHAGFIPADAAVVVAARDLPTCWDAFLALPTGRTLEPGLRVFFQDFEREVRLRTGIRPTPARWSTWLGRAVLAAQYEGAWGVCVRPGLLLRAATAVGLGGDTGNYNGIYYAWRDGFLVASGDAAWVAAARNATPHSGDAPLAVDALALDWADGHAVLRLEPGLPVAIALTGAERLPASGRRPRLPAVGGETLRPMLSLSAKSYDLLAAIVRRLDRAASVSTPWIRGRQRLVTALHAWGAGFDPLGRRLRRGGALVLALTEVDSGKPVPTPAGLLVQERGDDGSTIHPLDGVVAKATTLPGHWAGLEGAQVPLLGPALVLCTAATPEHWYATSRERVMNALATLPMDHETQEADAALRIYWPGLTQPLARLLLRSDSWNPYADLNPQVREQKYLPIARALEALGEARLYLRERPDGWRIEGMLDARVLPAS